MKIDEAREFGLFGRRVYVGHHFKKLDREEYKTAKEYDVAVAAARRTEYIDLREPGNDEIRKIMPADKATYTEAPDAVKTEKFKEFEEKNKDLDVKMQDLILDCISGSSFENDDGKPASLDEVRKMVKARIGLYATVSKDFGEIMQGFQTGTEGK